jgi:hypothetical protein
MDKVVVNETSQAKRKQKRDGRLRKVANTPTLAKQATLRDIKKHVKATFDA